MTSSLINQLEKKESIVKYLALFMGYRVLLEYVYIIAVSYCFEYLGFPYTPNISKCVISYLLFWFLICTLDRRVSINGILVNSFFAICIIPMLSFYWLADKQTLYIIYEVVFFLILNFISRRNVKPLVFSIGSKFNRYEIAIQVLFAGYVVLCVFFGLKQGGIDTRAFSFSSIYKLRSEGTSIDGVSSYILSWCAKSFFPVFLVYFLYVKQYLKVVICLCCQVFLYLCFGYKAYILSAVMTFVVYFIAKKSVMEKYESNICTTSIYFVALIPCALTRLGGILGKIGFSINNIFAMRMLFEPARIQNGYFDFFSSNNKLFFSEGLIGKLFGLHYPYDDAIGFVITRHLNGIDAVSNSNTGVIADSFSQLGVPGIVIIAILMGAIILFIKKICIYTPSYCITAMFFYPIFMWNDNPLLTNLLTNGLVLDIALLILVEGVLRSRTLREKHVEENKYVTI